MTDSWRHCHFFLYYRNHVTWVFERTCRIGSWIRVTELSVQATANGH